MTPNKSLFDSCKSCKTESFMMGNHTTCKTVGIGTVKIKMHDGIIRTSTNVRHVLGLRLNLISPGALNSICRNITISDGVVKVKWATMIVMKREKKANLNRFFSASVIGGVVVTTRMIMIPMMRNSSI